MLDKIYHVGRILQSYALGKEPRPYILLRLQAEGYSKQVALLVMDLLEESDLSREDLQGMTDPDPLDPDPGWGDRMRKAISTILTPDPELTGEEKVGD